MEVDLYIILFYEDENGNKPVEDFIDELDAAALNNKNARVQLEQIIYCLNRLEESGTRAGERFTKGFQVIYGSYAHVIIVFSFLDGREIIWFFYITSLKQRKRHLQRKLRLLKNEWTVGY